MTRGGASRWGRGRLLTTTVALWALAMSLLVASPPAAEGVPVGISFAAISPVEAGDLLVARTAADDPGDPPTWQLKADIWMDNTSGTTRDVTSVTISYPFSGQGSFTYTPMAFPSDDPPTTFSVPAGMQGRVPVYDGLSRDLAFPLPETVRIEVYLDSDPVPLRLDYGLAVRDNAVPNGAYLFPAMASDLDPGQYWEFRTRHVVDAGGGGGTLNPSTRTQRHSLDLEVVQWDADASQWRHRKPGTDGTFNSHYWGFGEPMYAMADGVITSCYQGELDHAPGSFDEIEFDNNFGNSLVIEHGGDRATYAHMKFGSIPKDLCPSPGQNDGLSIPVAAGQYIGDMGNTGRSTRAHLHLQVEHGDDTDPVQGVPIQFLNVRARGHDTNLDALGSTPDLRPLHGLALHRNSLVLPNPCGIDDLPPAGLAEVSRHGVPLACWQDVFNQVTSRGYRATSVDVHEVGGASFVNAVFRSDGPASVARHGLTGPEFQQVFDDLTDDGFRLHQVDMYLDDGEVRYAAIFEQRPGPAFAAFHGLSAQAYEAEVDELADAGFVPVNVSSVVVDGQWHHTGLFEAVDANGWTVETVPVGDYQDTFDANVAAGRVPVYVEGVTTPVGPHLTGVWVDPVGQPTTAVHGLSSGDYQDAYDLNVGAGRLTRTTTGYDDGAGNPRYAAVWRARPDTTLASTPDDVTNEATATFGLEASNPFTTFECRLDGGTYGACTTPHPVAGLGEGSHTFRARAVDRDDLRDPTPATHTWLVDLTPPEVDLTTPAEDTKTVHGRLVDDSVEDTTVIGWADVVVEATDALSGVEEVTFHVDGTAVPAGDVTHDPGTDTWSFTFAPDTPGQHVYTLQATATDVAGNVGSDVMQVVATATGKKGP